MKLLSNARLKLGIIAGGQLGKMLIQHASKWDIETHVLDPEQSCPACGIASNVSRGDYRNYDDVYAFGNNVDVLTYEIEHINVDALRALKKEGVLIAPDPEVLALIQDKGEQKKFYENNNIPTAQFTLYDDIDSVRAALEDGTITYPFVQKLRRGGYDGRGVAVIPDASELDELLDGASVIEPQVAIAKEIAIIASRNARGETACFPPVEMVFDPKANLVDTLVCPAHITDTQAKTATDIATRIITSLDMAGLLAVEFFITTEGEVLVNESAPRPHNSGHHTIESVVTSQYEQHVRAILNLPLGSTALVTPAVMVNLLGEPGHTGAVRYIGFTDALAIPGVNVHLYGKKTTRPMRKMGHVTVTADTIEEARENARRVKEIMKVEAWNNHE